MDDLVQITLCDKHVACSNHKLRKWRTFKVTGSYGQINNAKLQYNKKHESKGKAPPFERDGQDMKR